MLLHGEKNTLKKAVKKTIVEGRVCCPWSIDLFNHPTLDYIQQDEYYTDMQLVNSCPFELIRKELWHSLAIFSLVNYWHTGLALLQETVLPRTGLLIVLTISTKFMNIHFLYIMLMLYYNFFILPSNPLGGSQIVYVGLWPI